MFVQITMKTALVPLESYLSHSLPPKYHEHVFQVTIEPISKSGVVVPASVTFLRGSQNATMNIAVLEDNVPEDTETIDVKLVQVFGVDGSGVVTMPDQVHIIMRAAFDTKSVSEFYVSFGTLVQNRLAIIGDKSISEKMHERTSHYLE